MGFRSLVSPDFEFLQGLEESATRTFCLRCSFYDVIFSLVHIGLTETMERK